MKRVRSALTNRIHLTRRGIWHAVLLFAAALSASLEVPRVARSTVREAAEELADPPAAITDAATRLVSAAAESHLGFDTNIYPGDKAMDVRPMT